MALISAVLLLTLPAYPQGNTGRILGAVSDQSATYITDMSDRLKQEIRQQITVALETQQPPVQLAQDLFHRFGEANADWRR